MPWMPASKKEFKNSRGGGGGGGGGSPKKYIEIDCLQMFCVSSSTAKRSYLGARGPGPPVEGEVFSYIFDNCSKVGGRDHTDLYAIYINLIDSYKFIMI